MQRYKILWADDEIQLLKAHIIFLEGKGYEVVPVNSAIEALDCVKEEHFDLVFLDENMPGMTGLEALPEIKAIRPNLPIIMITKSEEEHIMEEAIGAKIADYLIKPLNPNQILLAIKKQLDNSRLVSANVNSKYQQAFQQISMMYNSGASAEEWGEIYKKLVYHELEIDNTEQRSMKEVLLMQKNEANNNFCRFVMDNFQDWMNGDDEAPLLSHRLFKQKVVPELIDGKKVFFIIIDNLMYSQWKVIQPLLTNFMKVEEDELYYSILPTTTSHARNALFSGLTPLEMSKQHPDWWVYEHEEGGMNKHESDFLGAQLKRLKLDVKYSYHKIFNNDQGKNLVNSLNNLLGNDLNAIVFNFVDMLSHARTDMQMIKELASDEAAYRSLAKSWFNHSPLFDLLKKLSEQDVVTVLTSDHGTIRVDRPHKIVGERDVNTNLRYKHGRNLNYVEKNTFTIKEPEKYGLPKRSVSASYVFALENYFFAYPNNFNYYVKHYTDTFQHGGVSMEEMLVPIVKLSKK